MLSTDSSTLTGATVTAPTRFTTMKLGCAGRDKARHVAPLCLLLSLLQAGHDSLAEGFTRYDIFTSALPFLGLFFTSEFYSI